MSLTERIYSYAAKQLQEAHPSLDKRRCIEHRQRKVSCGRCEQICPAGVYHDGKTDWSKCINCNLCVSVCPTRALCQSASNLTSYASLIANQDDLYLSCDNSSASTAASDLPLICLAALPWEMLAIMSAQIHVTLDCRHCGSCPHESRFELFVKHLDRTELLLGIEAFAEQITCLQEGDSCEQHGLMRRGALTHIFTQVVSFGSDFLLNSMMENDTPIDGSIYRRMLRNRLNSGKQEATWAYPKIDAEQCEACVICERICPNEAIHIHTDPEDAGYKAVYHAPSYCTECGLCENICPQAAISGWQLISSSNVNCLERTMVEVRHCSECEAIIPRNSKTELCKKCHEKGQWL